MVYRGQEVHELRIVETYHAPGPAGAPLMPRKSPGHDSRMITYRTLPGSSTRYQRVNVGECTGFRPTLSSSWRCNNPTNRPMACRLASARRTATGRHVEEGPRPKMAPDIRSCSPAPKKSVNIKASKPMACVEKRRLNKRKNSAFASRKTGMAQIVRRQGNTLVCGLPHMLAVTRESPKTCA